MEQSDLVMDLSDDDEDNVVRTIQLQKSLISESQSLTNRQVELTGGDPDQDQDSESAHGESQNDTKSALKDDESVYRDALAASVEYDNYLARLETNLKTLISECKCNLEEVSSIREGHKHKKNTFLPKCGFLYVFGAPYFKDKDYYPCPPNADTVQKKRNNEMCFIDLPPIRWWSPLQTKKLVDGIKDFALQACIKDAQNEKSALVRKSNALAEDDAERIKLKGDIENFDVKKVAQAHLNEKIASLDHDWLKLSASVLNGKHSAEECRGFWYNYLHPKFHKGKWTQEEEEKLGQLAEENNFQNWDLIASELGTSRSGYQCFAHFRSENVIEQFKQKWTKEEDDLLKAAVERLRVGDYIPWSQVTLNMKDRTKTQVYNRWSYSLNPKIKKGRFSTMEDIIILRGIQKWGEDFSKIASFTPDRTAPQLRMRYHSCLAKKDFSPWTLSEDKAILELVKEHGHNWTKIAKHLPGKLSVQVRRRHDTLVRWMRANPGKELPAINSRRNFKRSIYNCFPECWAYAEKLLSSGNPKAVSTSLHGSKARTYKAKVPRTRKRSLIDEKLLEYFQRIPTTKPVISARKFTSSSEVDPKIISDIASFLEVLGAKLDLPSDDQLEQDSTLTEEDKQVLRGLRNFHPEVLEGESDTLPGPVVENDTVTREDPPLVEMDPLDVSIDYVPKADPSSTQVKLQFSFDGEVDEAMGLEQAADEPNATAAAQQQPSHPLFGDLKYLCPPNLSTLVGLRSILLGKRKLVESISNFATDPVLSDIENSNDDSTQRAMQLWDDRLMCLFALPNLLTKLKPEERSQRTGGLPPLRGVSPDDDCQVDATPCTSGVFHVDTISGKDGIPHLYNPRKGKKRRLNAGSRPAPGTPSSTGDL